jgi:hypothetical protein
MFANSLIAFDGNGRLTGARTAQPPLQSLYLPPLR